MNAIECFKSNQAKLESELGNGRVVRKNMLIQHGKTKGQKNTRAKQETWRFSEKS